MISETLVPDRMMHGEDLYAQALDLILGKAQHRILLFDQDLTHGNFSSQRRFDVLNQFLRTNAASELHVIVHDAAYFLQKCPRLVGLLKIYAHKMTVNITSQRMKDFKSCFIVADNKHYIKRIHIDQARFRFAYDDQTQSEILHQQFLELQADATESLSYSTLGL